MNDPFYICDSIGTTEYCKFCGGASWQKKRTYKVCPINKSDTFIPVERSKTEIHLFLSGKYYSLYKEGLKDEEYREIKPYWEGRLTWGPDQYIFKQFQKIILHNGYTSECLEADHLWTQLGRAKKGIGKELFGSKDVYVIKLSNIRKCSS